MCSFGDGNAFARARVDDGDLTSGRRQRVERPLQRGFVCWVVPVFRKIAGKPGEHESHVNLLILVVKMRGMQLVHALARLQATRRKGMPEASSCAVALRVPLRIRSPSALVSTGTSSARRCPSSGP